MVDDDGTCCCGCKKCGRAIRQQLEAAQAKIAQLELQVENKKDAILETRDTLAAAVSDIEYDVAGAEVLPEQKAEVVKRFVALMRGALRRRPSRRATRPSAASVTR